MLMALNLPLPETIFAHGWWTVDGEKMSKSRGNVVDPNRMVDKYGADAFRYFLLREVPFGQDGDFSEQGMARRVNSDLANGIGNLLSRTLTMIERSCGGTIPDAPKNYLDVGGAENTYPLLVHARKSLRILGDHLDEFFCKFEFNTLLLLITSRVSDVDTFIDEHEPWKLAKDPSKRDELNAVLYSAAECLRILSLYIYPFMPDTAKNIAEQLGTDIDFSSPILSKVTWGELQSGTKIRKASALFPRVEVHTSDSIAPGIKEKSTSKKIALSGKGATPVSDTPSTPQPTPTATTPASAAATAPAAPAQAAPAQITIDEFMKIQLKTAKVISAERVPKSEKLLKLQVSLGTEQRQIVAGIGKKYEPDTLVGKTIIIVANLKPAKLMGIESQGMVLAAGDSEVRGLATIIEEVDPGTKVK
jgi:methionyl-tRNA synthetase